MCAPDGGGDVIPRKVSHLDQTQLGKKCRKFQMRIVRDV